MKKLHSLFHSAHCLYRIRFIRVTRRFHSSSVTNPLTMILRTRLTTARWPTSKHWYRKDVGAAAALPRRCCWVRRPETWEGCQSEAPSVAVAANGSSEGRAYFWECSQRYNLGCGQRRHVVYSGRPVAGCAGGLMIMMFVNGSTGGKIKWWAEIKKFIRW